MLRFSSPLSSSRFGRLFVAACLALFSTVVPAQTRFCLGGDLQHLSPVERAVCSAKLTAVREAAARFGAPEGWHFVMVCGAEGWKAYQAFSARSQVELEHAAADTDLQAHSTYLRGENFSNGPLDGNSERVLAHEIAGIVLGTTDEVAIKSRVDLWMKQTPGPRPETSVLTASRE